MIILIIDWLVIRNKCVSLEKNYDHLKRLFAGHFLLPNRETNNNYDSNQKIKLIIVLNGLYTKLKVAKNTKNNNCLTGIFFILVTTDRCQAVFSFIEKNCILKWSHILNIFLNQMPTFNVYWSFNDSNTKLIIVLERLFRKLIVTKNWLSQEKEKLFWRAYRLYNF